MIRITTITLTGLIVIGAFGCERPFLESTTVPEPPNDSSGCAPDAGVDELASVATVDGVELSWSSAATNADGFVIERRDAGTGTWGEIARAEAGAFEHTDADAAADSVFFYRARSYRVVEGQDCLSSTTGEIEQTSLAGPLTSIAARSLTPTSVELTWLDDNVTSESYRVQRRILNQDFADIGGVLAPAEGFTDVGLTPGLTYDYRVLVMNAGGDAFGGEVSIFSWEPPVLSWDGAPELDLACYMILSGSVTYAPTVDAAFDYADGSIDNVADVFASEVGIEGLLTDKSAGPFQASWTVTDNYGVSTTAVRDLELQRSGVTYTSARIPRGVGEDVGIEGLQLMYPGCADCLGHRGSISAGRDHTCATTGDDSLVCWGAGLGRNAFGSTIESRTPVAVVSGSPAAPFDDPLSVPDIPITGGQHSCVLTGTGEAKCWGHNEDGELGDGTRAQRSYPVGVCESGSGQACPKLGGITQIAVGRDHTCAVLASTEVRCWGDNQHGKVGIGVVEGNYTLPQVVCATGSLATNDCVPLTNVESIALGIDHTCASLNTGELRCWGSNTTKQIGRAPIEDVANPTPVCSDHSCTTVHTAESVGLGMYHLCGVQASGEIRCWGKGQYGRLGGGLGDDASSIERPSPTQVCETGRVGVDCVPLSGATRVVLGDRHSCAIVAGGEVRCWGSHTYGQLGSGEDHRTYPIPAKPYRVCIAGTESGGDCEPLTDVIEIAVGYDTSCAVTSTGDGWCWGEGGSRQLGIGNVTADQKNPVPVCGNSTLWSDGICNDGTGTDVRMTGLTSIAVSDEHTCAVGAGGAVYCWGNGSTWYPVLGDGTGNDHYTPVPVCLTGAGNGVDCDTGTPLTGATQVVANDRHTCALVGSAVWCWGDSDQGRLGIGSPHSDQLNPAQVCETGVWDNVSVCTGGNQLTGVRELAAGEKHTCALMDATGEVRCWGDNVDGQLGNGEVGTDQANPVTVCAAGTGGTCEALAGVRTIAAGLRFTCAVIDTTDEVFCWGQNDLDSVPLGVSVGDHSAGPVAVCDSGWGIDCVPWTGSPVSLHATDKATCMINEADEAFCWGRGSSGELGGGETGSSALHRSVPGPVCETGTWDGSDCTGNRLSGIMALDGGTDFYCANVGGTAKCWGEAGMGRLGNGVTSPDQGNPIDVCHPDGCASGTLPSIEWIAAGDGHACAVGSNGEVWCWGQKIGSYSLSAALLPEPVCRTITPDPIDPMNEICDPVTDATAVAAGEEFACLRTTTGETQCWGDNFHGALGAYPAPGQSNPSPACASGSGASCVPMSSIVSVNAGTLHTCAITETGGALCWGLNSDGQLGIGYEETVDHVEGNPVEVCASGENTGDGCMDDGQPSPLTGLLAIAAGGNHTCALTDAGTIKCWGMNPDGQLGNGETATKELLPQDVVCSGSPIPAPGCNGPGPQANVVGLTAGLHHTCALLGDGTIVCWGGNGYGQLGIGHIDNRTRPVHVNMGGVGAVAIAAGEYHTCVILEDEGQVACWGYDDMGQLGTGQPGSAGSYSTAPKLVCASGADTTCVPFTGAQAITAGRFNTCVIADDPDSTSDPQGNRVLCWGADDLEALAENRGYPASDGHPNPAEICAPETAESCEPCQLDAALSCADEPICAQKLTNVVAITVGRWHGCALAEDYGIFCWGQGADGRRGDGLGLPGLEGEHCTAQNVCDVATGACNGTDTYQNAALQSCDLITLVE